MSASALPRVLERSRRIDLRVVVGLLLFVVGVFATSGFIRQANERTPVFVAARTLQPGQMLSPSDLRVAEVGLAPGVAAIPAGSVHDLAGKAVMSPLEEGQILSPASVAAGSALVPGQVAMSVAVAPSHAAGGALRAGDHVMVLSTQSPDRMSASTAVLLSEVEILSVETEDGAGVEPAVTVTVAISENDAPALAQAANSGVIDLVLLPTGGSP